MDDWRSSSTSHEIASDGSPAPLAWWRSRLWLLVAAGTLAGLVVGLLVGASTGLPGRAEDKPSSSAPVTVGVVSEVREGPTGGWDFELPVFNATATPVDARVVAFERANFAVASDEEKALAAGTWGKIRFSVTANCDVPAPGPLSSVRVRVQTEDGVSVAAFPLPDAGMALRDYHRAVCASADPVSASKLVGVWIVEQAYGPDTWLVGTRSMRFDSDGSFTADPGGRLYSSDIRAQGRYRLDGELLTISVRRNDGCVAPSTVTWRVTVRGEEMSMVWVRGVCPGGRAGDAWVLRRVLPEAAMPGSPN